jgi:transcriptional regulator with XRE-family HTH domain
MAVRIRSIFAENLKRIRAEQDISQEKLALKAGIERAYIGLIERQKSSPTIDMVEKIAKVLKVAPDELLKPPGKSRG